MSRTQKEFVESVDHQLSFLVDKSTGMLIISLSWTIKNLVNLLDSGKGLATMSKGLVIFMVIFPLTLIIQRVYASILRQYTILHKLETNMECRN